MPTAEQRSHIERSLRHPLALIAPQLRAAYNAYQLKHYWRFLLLVNILAQAAFLSYGFADALILPDLAWVSPLVRAAFIAMFFPGVLILFRRCRNVELLDLVLPICVVPAAIVWYVLLSMTAYETETYLYASLVFIVLANLGVQVRFLPSLVASLLITAVNLIGVATLSQGTEGAMQVFLVVYFPVFFFSLFISWSTTLDRRRAFLRAQLDEMNRRDLARANERLQALAHTDPLTGLHNRRHFEEAGRKEVQRAQRQRLALSLLALDIDHFKHINDTYGHDVGDKVLQALSQRGLEELREIDLLARFGGEEFIVLLPDTPLEQARQVAERLRTRLAECRVEATPGVQLQCTLSIGVAELNPQNPDLDALLKAADQALYKAKNSGRNRVCEA